MNFEKTQGMGISCHLSHHTSFDGAFSFIYGDVWSEGSVSATDDPPDLRAALLAFLIYPAYKSSASLEHIPIYDWILAVVSVIPGVYAILHYDEISDENCTGG